MWQVLTYGVFSGLYFPKFGLNAEIFRGDPRFQSQYKNKDQKKLCIWTLFTQWSSLKVTIVETIGFLFRSSRLHVFYQKFALKNIWKYSENVEVARPTNSLKKDFSARISQEFCETFRCLLQVHVLFLNVHFKQVLHCFICSSAYTVGYEHLFVS